MLFYMKEFENPPQPDTESVESFEDDLLTKEDMVEAQQEQKVADWREKDFAARELIVQKEYEIKQLHEQKEVSKRLEEEFATSTPSITPKKSLFRRLAVAATFGLGGLFAGKATAAPDASIE